MSENKVNVISLVQPRQRGLGCICLDATPKAFQSRYSGSLTEIYWTEAITKRWECILLKYKAILDPVSGREKWDYMTVVNTEIRLIIFFAAKDGDALYSQQNQDWELVPQTMNFLLPNSDLNWRKWGKPVDHSSMT